MLTKINDLLLRIFAHSDINKMFGVLAALAVTLWLFVSELAPLLAAVLIAYVLDGIVVAVMAKLPIKRAVASTLVIVFVMLLALAGLYAVPKLLFELRGLGDTLPKLGLVIEKAISNINAQIPEEIALDKEHVASRVGEVASGAAEYLLNNTLNIAGDVFTVFLYFILIPLLVFFLLKDKDVLRASLVDALPSSAALRDLWIKVDEQFGSYVRGKVVETIIVGFITWWGFLFFDLNYGFTLAMMVGLSAFVPFVGVLAVTFPVVLFAYLQFGWSGEFAGVVAFYAVVMALDGQLLVPLLFSEAVKIHPVSIFAAIIFFGNLWGVWGVFFAIPLAAIIKSVILVIRQHGESEP